MSLSTLLDSVGPLAEARVLRGLANLEEDGPEKRVLLRAARKLESSSTPAAQKAVQAGSAAVAATGEAGQ